MPSYGGGLSYSLGVITESTVGTEATVNAWYEVLGDTDFTQTPTFLDSAGLKAGQAYKRVSRTQISRYDVAGTVSLEHYDRGFSAAAGRGMGWWWKHALGSAVTTATQIAASTAYQQVHTPGSKDGLSFTAQAGLPEAASPFTSRPFTYRGCKVSQWDFSCNDGQLAQLKLTVDGWRENTATSLVSPAYAGASYQPGIFSFADAATFTLGGTASTSGGVTSIAGGTTVTTVCKGITMTGQTPLAGDRYGLGNAGVKREQIHNGIPMITGALNGEFTSRTEIYDLFAANTTTAIQLDFAHGDAGSSNPYRLSLILPAVKIKVADVKLNGADILQQDIQFEAFDDGSGTNPVIQVRLVSQDQNI